MNNFVIITTVCSLLNCSGPQTDETSQGETNDLIADERVSEEGYVSCKCKILEFEEEHFDCDYGRVPEGSPHSQGVYPWVSVEIQRPQKHAGRIVEILFKSSEIENKSGNNDTHVGKSCSMKLPGDFLDGEYKSIDDYSVREFRILGVKPEGT